MKDWLTPVFLARLKAGFSIILRIARSSRNWALRNMFFEVLSCHLIWILSTWRPSEPITSAKYACDIIIKLRLCLILVFEILLFSFAFPKSTTCFWTQRHVQIATLKFNNRPQCPYEISFILKMLFFTNLMFVYLTPFLKMQTALHPYQMSPFLFCTVNLYSLF